MTGITLANVHEALQEVDAWVDAYPAETVLALWEARAWEMLEYPSWEALCDSRGWTKRVALPRPERREVVATLRQEGMSTRAIAAATGVSHQTVANDLESGVKKLTPEPVRGTDGKTYAPTQPVRPTVVSDPEPVETIPAGDYADALARYPELDVPGAEVGDVVRIAAMIDARPEHERDMRTDAGAKWLAAKADGRVGNPKESDPTESGQRVYEAIYEALRVIDRWGPGVRDALRSTDPTTADIWQRTFMRMGERTGYLLDAVRESGINDKRLRRVK